MEEAVIATPKSLVYRIKEFIIKMSLFLFGATFELVSKYSKELKKELGLWEEGRAFSLGIMNGGPAITVQKKGDRAVFVGMGHYNPKLSIYFKNVDGALLVFLGQVGRNKASSKKPTSWLDYFHLAPIGSHMSSIEQRIFLHGDQAEAIQTVRAMNIVQKYLFPDFILKRSFKVPPTYTIEQLVVKGLVYCMLGLALAMNLPKLFKKGG